MQVRLLVGTVLGVFLGCTAALAQLNTGSVLGTVFDSSRAVVASARVAIENQGTGFAVESITDAQGNFLVPVLPVGTYQVTVSSDGFKSQLKEDIRLRVSDRVRLLFSLEPGAVTETVTVSGQAPLVETASSTLGLVVELEQIDALPLNGRNISDLLHLVPGSVLRTQGTKQAFNGVSLFRQQGGLRFLLDGGDASRIDFDILDNTYGSSKGRISRTSAEAIQEFRVYTNSFSAEFGQTLGGVVNVITKSGSNQMHGSLFEYFRNEKLDSRNYFNHAGDKPPFRLNQFGVSLGGPIARERVFFFEIQCLGRRAGRRIVQGAGVVWAGDNAPSGQGGSARWGGQRSSCAGGWQLHGARQAWRGPGRPAGQRVGGAGGSAEEQGDGLVRVQAQLRHAPFDIRRFQQP